MGVENTAVRFVVYWKGGLLEGSQQQLKVNLVLYENELLQVSGSGFFLWTMDNYQVTLPSLVSCSCTCIWSRTSPDRWTRRCWTT